MAVMNHEHDHSHTDFTLVSGHGYCDTHHEEAAADIPQQQQEVLLRPEIAGNGANQFLNALFRPEDGLIELRALPGPVQLFAAPSNTADVQQFIHNHQKKDIYYGVAARKDSSSGRLTNCSVIRTLFADIDFKSTPEAEARRILGSFPLTPSYVIHSGGGFHAYWLLSTAYDLQQDPVKFKNLLRSLAIQLHADLSSAEPAHILRIPGTTNWKPAYPNHPLVRIETANPDLEYELSDFEFLPEEDRTERAVRISNDQLPDAHEMTKRARAYLRKLPDAVEGERGDQATYQAAAYVRDFGLLEEECYALMLEDFNPRCTPPWSESELRKKVHNAYTYAKNDPGCKLDQGLFQATGNNYGHPAKELSTNSVKNGWEKPISFRKYDLPTFPVHVFPDWLRKFIEAVATASQTPNDLAAMLALTILAVCCQKRVIVKVNSGYSEPTNLYTVTAMPPANRKSAVFKAMNAPIGEYEREQVKRMVPDIAAAQTNRKILENALHENEQAAAKAKNLKDREGFKAEAEALARKLATTIVPVAPRLLADDVTSENLITLLHQQNGRMAVMSPEGDLFQLMAGRYTKNSDPNIAVYLKGHPGDDLRVDRSGRPPEYVRDPTLTLGFTVQPEVIQGLSKKQGFRGLGLLARFLYSLPESMLGHRHVDPPSIPDDVRDKYHRSISALLARPYTTDESGNIVPDSLPLSSEANDLRKNFAYLLEPMLRENDELGIIQDWAGKLVGAVIRIAGLLHMAQNAHADKPCAIPISSKTMESAIRVGRYLIPHALAAFLEMGADPTIEEAKHILSWIEKNDQPRITKRDIFEGTKGRFKRAADLDKPLEILIEYGYIRNIAKSDPHGPGRPPSPVFEVNPYVVRNSANKNNSANIANVSLEILFEDLFTKNKNIIPFPPPPSVPSGQITASHYSHNSQKGDQLETQLDTAETDYDDYEEIVI